MGLIRAQTVHEMPNGQPFRIFTLLVRSLQHATLSLTRIHHIVFINSGWPSKQMPSPLTSAKSAANPIEYQWIFKYHFSISIKV